MQKLLATCMLFLLLSSCKKETASADETTSTRLTTLPDVKAALMKEILIIAKDNPEFRKAVESECLKQVRGDYNVSFDRLLEIDAQRSIIPVSEKLVFKSLVSSMKAFRPGEMPIIFVPVMESRDPKNISPGMTKFTRSVARTASHAPANPNNTIIMVDQDNQVLPDLKKTADTATPNQTSLVKRVNLMPDPGGDDPGGGGSSGGCATPYYYPGYIIDNYGNLTYSDCINEAYAWDHDVWVLGYEEVVSPGNDVASANDTKAWISNNSDRYEGYSEGGGWVQVHDINSIEPWVKGKLEFKYFVNNSTGTSIKDNVFGKWSRSNFDSDPNTGPAWVMLGDFIGNWNTSVWGNVTYEHWIEEDGGSGSSLTQNISYTINGQTYTTTIIIPARDRDDDLGMANVQFTDNVFAIPYTTSYGAVYTLNHMNVKRTKWY